MAHLLQRLALPQVRVLVSTTTYPIEGLYFSHASHHLLAIYAMGADEELLRAAYDTHTVYQKPAFPPPDNKKIDTIIDDSNWKDYLGDDR